MRRRRNRPVRLLMVGCLAASATLSSVTFCLQAHADSQTFPNALPTDRSFFPIAVWLQQPHSAAQFKAIGINTFVALARPPTSAMLAQLEAVGIYLIVEQTPEALQLKHSPTIRGWIHVDEPDNAQPDGRGGHGDCILPDDLVRRYEEMRARDATRPVFVTFGQGVANPTWVGRGRKCGAITPEQYYKAASRGADVVAFDIYPVADTRHPHVMGRLDYVGRGVRNLKQWVPAGTPIWADIETTHINNTVRRPMPQEVYSEVWIALINGAVGINYFVHEWTPSFREDAVFRYPDVVTEIKRLNAQIKDFAPLINSPTIENEVTMQAPAEVAYMVKRDIRMTYLFAVNMQNRTTRTKVSTRSKEPRLALVVGENRNVELVNGSFEDRFLAYEVHIYRWQTE